AQFLAPESRAPTAIDSGHARALDLAIEIPSSPLEAVMAGEVWDELYDRLAQLIGAHRTTLVFVNTRRLAERLTLHLSERIGAEHVTSHHGSLSKEKRLDAEQRLKEGKLKALVATASLELGIDIGAVDLVCQIGSTRSIATLLQRVGRGAYVHYDGVNRRLRGRRGARLAALTSGGAIPDIGDYRVVLEPTETFVGTLNEDFAIESMPGDIFQLGNASYRITRVESG